MTSGSGPLERGGRAANCKIQLNLYLSVHFWQLAGWLFFIVVDIDPDSLLPTSWDAGYPDLPENI